MGRYKYKDQFTEEDIQADIERRKQDELDRDLPIKLKNEDIRKLSEDWFKLESKVNSLANSMDVPEKYWDFWFAYGHFDNDFDRYFEEIADELAETFVRKMKGAVSSYAWYTHDKKEGEEITYPASTLEKYMDDVFERDLRVFRDEDTLEKAIRTSVALKTAIADVNDQGFDKEFSNILDYFKPIPDHRDHCYLGKERVFQLLNKAQCEPERIIVTPENYKNCWWNGDIMVCHISGEKIDIL